MSNLIELTNNLIKENQIQVYGNTNQTLYEDTDQAVFNYYLPAYMQLQFNSIAKVDYETLKAQVYCEITFTLNVKGLPEFIIDHLKQNIMFYFNNDKTVNLKVTTGLEEEEPDTGYDEDDDDDENKAQVFIDEEEELRAGLLMHRYLIFTIRKEFVTGMVADVKFTPFELIDLVLSIFPKVVKPIDFAEIEKEAKNSGNYREWWEELPTEIKERIDRLKERQTKKTLKQIKLWFNLMDCPDNKANTIYFETNRDFGTYAVADKKINVEFTNNSVPKIIIKRSNEINDESDLQEGQVYVDYNKIGPFNSAHFIISIFKIPNSALFNIAMPTLLLSVINLGIFNQNNTLGPRIENLATLILAFMAIFPVIRGQIPPSPNVTYFEMLIYLFLVTDLLCLIQGLILLKWDGAFDVWKNVFFVVAFSISVAIFSIIFIATIVHYVKWLPSYKATQQYIHDERFEHLRWRNQECDTHYMRFFDSGRIKAVQYDQ